MLGIDHFFSTPVAVISHYWNCWKAACNYSILNYYNQRIETNPEGEAYQYWCRLIHPQSGIDPIEVTDAKLSHLMNSLLEQGISKFSVDRFILELRRLKRSTTH